MSRTPKDSNQIKKTVLEVVKKNDGTFDLFLNGKLDRNNIPETWRRSSFVCASESAVRSTTRFFVK